MRRRHGFFECNPKRLAAVSMTVLVLVAASRGQQSQIEQARQFQRRSPILQAADLASPAGSDIASTETRDEESFGLQQLLKRQERVQPFRAFGEISGFMTNNVALTRQDEISDAFLVANFGIEARHAFTNGLQFDALGKYASFRYDQTQELDFNAVDFGAGLSYRAPALWDLDLFGRYHFNELLAARSGDPFFKNHTVTSGVQRAFAFSRAHGAFVGATASFSFADPEVAERDEYSAYAGYSLQATRNVQADVLYRYGRFVYTEGDRNDDNHTFSFAIRYRLGEFFTAFGTAYGGLNRSNEEIFDYDAGNLGCGLGLAVRF